MRVVTLFIRHEGENANNCRECDPRPPTVPTTHMLADADDNADRAPATLPAVLIPATEDDAPVDEFSSVMSAMMDDDDEDATGAKKGYTFKNWDDDEEEDDDGFSNSSENDNDSNC